LIPKKQLRWKPKVRYRTNNIIFRDILVFGFQASGKTETARTIAERLCKYYGTRNVNCVVSEKGNLGLVLRYGLKNKLVNFLFIDNLTLQKVSRETLHQFFKSRMLLEEYYGRRQGYILTLLALHRFFSIPVELRTPMGGIIVKNSSLNPYDRAFIKRLIGEETITLLDKLETERLKKPKLRGLAYFKCRSFSGIVNFKLASKNYLWNIDEKYGF